MLEAVLAGTADWCHAAVLLTLIFVEASLVLCLLHLPQAREVADTAVGLLQQHNRRTLDAIGARIYFYYSWAYECTGALADVRR
jgi:hypothetical protein